MADNVAITAGAGTSVGTDEVSTVHYQRVKPQVGADGARDDIIPVANGQDTTGTGVQAVGPLAQLDDTSPGAVTENQFAPLRINNKRALHTVIRDGEDNDRGAFVTSANALKVDGSAVTQPVSGTVSVNALPTGSNNIGDVDVLTVPENAGAAASTLNSTSSDGGTALTNSAQAIKGSAGKLLGYYIYNPNSTAVFVQFYNTAAGSVTVGTTNPLFMLTIPALSAANLWMQPGGIAFGTAMSWAAVSTAGGNGAPTTALDAVAWFV